MLSERQESSYVCFSFFKKGGRSMNVNKSVSAFREL